MAYCLFIAKLAPPPSKSKILKIRLQQILMQFEPQFPAHNYITICPIQFYKIRRGIMAYCLFFEKVVPPEIENFKKN